METLQSFIYLSRYSGMREDLAQAGGGNSSVKISENEMLIKASGCQLAELSDSFGFCKVNHNVITDFFNGDNLSLSEQTEKQLLSECLLDGNRPSIETFLHSITQKYTLHTHPTVVNVLASTDEGWSKLKNLFGDALFVEYATPGIKLAAEYFSAYKAFGKVPNVIFLKNHGLVVSGNTEVFVKNTTENVLLAIENEIGLDMERYHAVTRIYDVIKTVPELQNKIVYLSQNADIKNGLEHFGSGLWDYQFCPDCLVYCGKKALSLGDAFSKGDFEKHIFEHGLPVIIVHKQNIYILSDSVKKAKDVESVLSFSAQVAIANKKAKLNLLSDEEQNFLLNWDAEKYRQSVK